MAARATGAGFLAKGRQQPKYSDRTQPSAIHFGRTLNQKTETTQQQQSLHGFSAHRVMWQKGIRAPQHINVTVTRRPADSQGLIQASLPPWSSLEFSIRWHVLHLRTVVHLAQNIQEVPFPSHKPFWYTMIIFQRANSSNSVISIPERSEPWLLNNDVMITSWPFFGWKLYSGCQNLNRMLRERNLWSLLYIVKFVLRALLMYKPLCWVTLKHVKLHLAL